VPLQKKTPFLQFGTQRQDTSAGGMSSVVPHHSACFHSRRQYSQVVSFHVYTEVKRILYPTFRISLGASLQPSPQYVPYRNIIQSCELGSQGQVSPSIQILKEETSITALLAKK